MAVDEAHGGWGATELDLALVAEQHGRAIAAAPLIETQVAAGLLAECGESGAPLLAAALSGRKLVTFAPRPARGQRIELVPAGAVADIAIALVDDSLVPSPSTKGYARSRNLASMPLADVPVDDRAVVLGARTGRVTLSTPPHWIAGWRSPVWRWWASPPEQLRSAPSTPSNDTRSVPQSEPSRRCHIRWRTARLRWTVHACSD